MIIDSKQKQLTMPDIIKNALEQMPNNTLSFHAVFLSIVKELTLKGAGAVRKGNTLFIFHKIQGKKRIAFFRALNCDTPQNYLEHSKEFTKEMYTKYGNDVMFTQFTDPSLLSIFKYIAKGKPKDMGYHAEHFKDKGLYQVTVKLGKPRK